MNKYEAGSAQGRFQPGSNHQVLENKLSITDPAERDEAELVLLEKLYEDVLLHNLPVGQIEVAIVHVELILIHPFRDGNGRISRLLADVMLGQAGYPPLDYSDWDQNKADYFAAIRQGLEMNYAPMIELVAQAMGNN